MPRALARLLLIEDDRETADQIAEFLIASGYDIDRAGDGGNGLSRARGRIWGHDYRSHAAGHRRDYDYPPAEG
jgi:CheY-like chemotaxis protein